MSIVLALLPIAIAAVGSVNSRRQLRSQGEAAFALETRMTDPRIVRDALAICGCKASTAGTTVDSALQGSRIAFEQAESGAFNAVFYGTIPGAQAEEFLGDLYGEYSRLVQQEAYLKLKERAAAKGLILESEDVQNDGSIVLTLRIAE
jgi:hypothetical protein